MEEDEPLVEVWRRSAYNAGIGSIDCLSSSGRLESEAEGTCQSKLARTEGRDPREVNEQSAPGWKAQQRRRDGQHEITDRQSQMQRYVWTD